MIKRFYIFLVALLSITVMQAQSFREQKTPCVQTNKAPVDYTNGVFIVNEDWFGHQNSTLNFISNDGEWTYRVIQKENPGKELGATAQYGTIYGDKFYIISKQEKDPGASIVGGRLTIADAKTLKMEKQLTTFATNSEGKSIADGRSFLGVDETKAYIGTTNGIYILDLTTNEIKGQISGAEGSATDLYSGQIGNMVRVDNKVYAVHQTKGLIVIDAITDKVRKVIPAEEGWGFGSVVLSKDGNLCSVLQIKMEAVRPTHALLSWIRNHTRKKLSPFRKVRSALPTLGMRGLLTASAQAHSRTFFIGMVAKAAGSATRPSSSTTSTRRNVLNLSQSMTHGNSTAAPCVYTPLQTNCTSACIKTSVTKAIR
nr:DUF5074 domain-containing protein [Prevotella corporis]